MKVQARRSAYNGRLKATVIYNASLVFVPNPYELQTGEWKFRVVDEMNESKIFELDDFYPVEQKDIYFLKEGGE